MMYISICDYKKLKVWKKFQKKNQKTIMVRNTEFDKDDTNDMPEEFSIWELAVGDDFCMISSTAIY